MYLMTLANYDYVLATIFFGLIFLSSYLFRRKQQSAKQFLFADVQGLSYQNNNWITGFGVIELVAFGAIGAIYGFSGLYYIFVILISSTTIIYYLSKIIYPDSIYEYLSKKVSIKFSAIYAILAVILLLFILSITIVLTSKLFLSLLGWNFVNSIFGLTLLSLICIEVGGYAGLKYNRNTWLSIVTLGFIFVIVLALQILPISSGITNLEQLAINQGKAKDLYTSFNYVFNLKNIILAAIPIVVILPFITAIKISKPTNSMPIGILKLVLIILMVFCGILAIETQANNLQGSKNSKIITYQAQLPDGQMGYIIKSVEASGVSAKNPIPGIVPPLLNEKTSLIEANKYDYKLANIVVFRHYLPTKLMFLIVLMIMAIYMYAISNYILAIAKIITLDICPPLNLLSQYGEEGKLWCSRMSVIFTGAIAIFSAYFLQKWFHLMFFSYIVFTFAGFLLLILLLVMAKNGKK